MEARRLKVAINLDAIKKVIPELSVWIGYNGVSENFEDKNLACVAKYIIREIFG